MATQEIITQDDREKLQKLISRIAALRTADPAKARAWECELCGATLKELEGVTPANSQEEAEIELAKFNLQQVLDGGAVIEDVWKPRGCSCDGAQPGSAETERPKQIPFSIEEFSEFESIFMEMLRISNLRGQARFAIGAQRKELRMLCTRAMQLRDLLGFRFYPDLLKAAYPDATFIEGPASRQ